jgi:hypothetical protein
MMGAFLKSVEEATLATIFGLAIPERRAWRFAFLRETPDAGPDSDGRSGARPAAEGTLLKSRA